MKIENANEITNINIIDELSEYNENDVEFLALAIINIKAAGMKRNRGMGHIKCEIFEDGKEIGKELAKNVLKRGGLYNEAN